MGVGRTVLVVVLAGVAAAVPARAGTTPVDGRVMNGPLLAGDQAVWVQGDIGQRRSLWAATPGGPARELWPGRPPVGCELVDKFDTAGEHVLLTVRHNPKNAQNSCMASNDVSTVLMRTDGSTWSWPSTCPSGHAWDIEGTQLLVAKSDCGDMTVLGLDDGRIVRRVNSRAIQRMTWIRQAELAGDYAAVMDAPTGLDLEPQPVVVVVDLRTGEEAYRVTLRPWFGPFVAANFLAEMEIEPDGSLTVGIERWDTPGRRGVLLAASRERPEPRLLSKPVLLDQYGSRQLAQTGSLLALYSRWEQEMVLLDTTTDTVHSVFDRFGAGVDPGPAGPEGGVDWDGRRLVWEHDGIRNESYPHTAPERRFPVAPGAPRPAGTAKGGARPAGCVVPNLRRRTLAGARRALARAHCRLGSVRKRRSRARASRRLVVTGQRPRPRTRRARGARVKVTLARPVVPSRR